MLNCADPQLYQFVTYAFLHADWGHLIGNLLFLYIFGNSLNDKLGHAEYLLFYLGGAVFSGAAYCVFTDVPMLGASGAIAAVTTGFLVLFPLSRILVLYILFFIGTFEVSSLVLIGIKMVVWDNIIAPSFGEQTNVAYGAHLAGYLFGFVAPLGLLAVRVLPRDQFDIISLWSRRLRRRQFRRGVQTSEYQTGIGYRTERGHQGHKTARPVQPATRTPETAPTHPQAERIAEVRGEIDEALGRYDLTTAAESYLQLIKVDENQVLARRGQLDVANQLMSEKRFANAAVAYEKYLKHYSNVDQGGQVELLLGIIYSRHAPNPDRAKKLLAAAIEVLPDENQRELCRVELDRLG